MFASRRIPVLRAPVFGFVALVGAFVPPPVDARPYKPGEFTSKPELLTLKQRVGAHDVGIKDHCLRASVSPCPRRSLAQFKEALKALEQGGDRKVRVLQLGDSHIASDFISGYVREELQAKFGVGGRGLMHADQRWGYGGRKIRRAEKPWHRTRVVDSKGPGHPYGLFGIALRARTPRAFIDYRILPEDAELEVHYAVGPSLPGFSLSIGGKVVATAPGQAPKPGTNIHRVALPPRTQPTKVRLQALGKGATVYGIGFESSGSGVVLSSIGPVGADAKVYLQLEQNSFRESLRAARPDLVVLMVGGNDALKVRKKWKSLETVIEDHRVLIDVLRHAVPSADILLMSPMDAGVAEGGKWFQKLSSRRCVWSSERSPRSTESLFGIPTQPWGGTGPFNDGYLQKVMSKDLVHPRKRAADLLGKLLADAILAWYES